MRNGGKGREKPPLASRRGRPGHRGCFAPICPRRRPIVNRRPTEGGKGLAILRPGVMGLTVHRAPPFAPPPAVAIPWPPPDVSGEPSPRCRPIVRRRLWGCEDGPERRRGPPPIAPLPGAPSGDPTPITQSVEEFLSRLRLSSFLINTYSAYRRPLHWAA